ncbi:DegV family protein [Eubacterium multiforme]|uniref:DegV family protein with EDD domain n=1 Tax=Eubacterium multiforme TaxID=83339 RepID=A0ABT9UV64_9FIRM|nr:DegV family protein [Eubacterium multiforme]MDQ0150217.1 DegV family protein with EDD domain [Eubacterium multiforme]
MQKIAVLTDSGSDLTLEQLKDNNIEFTPFKIIYSTGEFEDKIDLSPEEVYASLDKEVPTTSLPSTARIENILTKLEEEGYTHVIAVTISSGLSGTSNAIRLALEDHPKLISYVFDTKILSMAEGALVLNAAELVKEGKTFEEIIEELPKLRKKTYGYFTINTLEYLKKGGRIGKVAGTIGEILNLKPIISVDDEGVYYTYAKVRGRKQSINRLLKIAKEHLDKCKCKVWVLNGGSSIEEFTPFYEAVSKLHNIESIAPATIGPALGVHTGPGLLGLIFQEV